MRSRQVLVLARLMVKRGRSSATNMAVAVMASLFSFVPALRSTTEQGTIRVAFRRFFSINLSLLCE
jgi:hypothetical protein